MIDSTIGRYRIVEKLGEGGMGEVFKAEDTSLSRHVALKFLAAHLLNDKEAKQRFLREARAAAAVRHPNICTVFEVAEEDEKTFIAMDYLDGESLEDRIAKGPLPLRDALEIGRQVAEGLEAAHEKGIVHRDIKPANIMVDAKERATILDFGLARLAEASKLTRADQTIGTAAYMSPEQIQGGEVDHRSDIWALGCVLYEMVAGVRPFPGQYDQALAYEIVNQSPEPLTSVRAGVPMELEFIVGKCLAKDAGERYQHTDELLLDLQGLRKKLDSGKSALIHSAVVADAHPGPVQADGSPTAHPLAKYRVIENVQSRDDRVVFHAEDTQRGRLVDVTVIPQSAAQSLSQRKLLRHAAVFAAGVVLTVLLGLATGWLGQPSTPAEMPVRRFSFAPDDGRSAVISPDGRHIAYRDAARSGGLWVRDLDAEEPRLLQHVVAGDSFAWSPDSKFIGFAEEGALMKVSLAGGPAAKLCDLPEPNLAGVSWSPDGESIIFGSGRVPVLYEIAAQGGSPTPLFEHVETEQGQARSSPKFLPKRGPDNALLFQVGPPAASEIFVWDFESEEAKKLIPGAYPTYSPTGHLLYTAPGEGDLRALPFSLSTLEATGESFSIVPGADHVSVASDGTLVYMDPAGLGMRQLVWRDRTGRHQGTIGQPHVAITYPALSPDRRRVAASGWGDNGMDVWIHEVDRPVKSLLNAVGHNVWPTWSQSGEKIGFASGRTGDRDIYVKSMDGSGEPVALWPTDAAEYLTDWSRDEKTLLFWRRPAGGTIAAGSGTAGDIFFLRQRSDGSYEEFPFLTSEFEETTPQFSPDERFVAYTSNESGRREVYIQAFPEGGLKRQVSVNGGGQPRWVADGREIYYVEGERLMAAPVEFSPSLSVGDPQELFSSPGLVWLPGNYLSYDVTPDGKRVVLAERVEAKRRREIHVVQNWYEEFRNRERD